MTGTILILFICVSAVHMGLTDAISKALSKALGEEVHVLGCAKCMTFWCVLAWCALKGAGIVESLAIAFALAYAALWLDLLMGAADTLYMKIYERIINPQDADTSPQAYADHEKDTLPKL